MPRRADPRRAEPPDDRWWWWKKPRRKSVSALEKCARPPSLLILFLSVCLGCGDLYGMLVTPCVISISVMSISIAWGDWGVVSQMVQCQGPQVWFRRWRAPLIPSSPKSCHLSLPRCHLSSHRVKARPDSPRCLWPMSQLVFVVSVLFFFIFLFFLPLISLSNMAIDAASHKNPDLILLSFSFSNLEGGQEAGSQKSAAKRAVQSRPLSRWKRA